MLPPLQNIAVCMDGRMLAPGGTGVATYARALRAALPLVTARPCVLNDRPQAGDAIGGRARMWLSALSRVPRQARPATGDGSGSEAWFFAPDLFRAAQVHFNLYGRLLEVRLPILPGIMHWTYPVPLKLVGWTNFYAIHDAIPLVQPGLSPIDPARHRRLLDAVAAAAAGIVTVSAAARDAIVEALGCPAEFVVDCSQPVDGGAAPPSGPLPPGLDPGRYLIVCGTVEPRKNIARILAAYRMSGVALPLVIAGPDGWRSEEVAADIAATPGIVRLPDLRRDEMLALIAGARALLMPSLAEGFGLPVVEAMALGTPAAASGSGALAEVAGGAALPVDPEDVAAIGDAMRRLADDDALCATLRSAGLARARQFTVAGFAAALARLYTARIAGPG